MAARASVLTVRPAQGGRLINTMSHENVGPANYVEKTNWRRVEDREVAREGYVKFRPNTGLPQGSQHLDISGEDSPEIVGLWEAIRPNGERALVALSWTTVYRYDYSTGTWDTIGSGYSATARRWQVKSLDGYLIFNNAVDLPFTFQVQDDQVYPIYEMRENGIASVGTIAVFNGLLLAGDLTEIASDYLATQMNSEDPYGLVDNGHVNRVRYKVGWSDYGNPRNWSPVIAGTIESTDKDVVVLDFPSLTFIAGETRVAVIGAGINGGTLGGGTGFEEGVLVTDVTDNELTLETSADPDLDYPLSVQVTRFADLSTFAGSASLQDDSAAITRMEPLNRGILAVYRETGIFHGRYTGVAANPFQFVPVYSGRNVPFYPDALHEIDGERHVYATENRFYVYDGAGEPQVFRPLDDARTSFFSGLNSAAAWRAFAAHNPLTKEVWFFSVNGVLALDYVQMTASWIDEAYTAAAYVRRPDGTASVLPSEQWFVIARAGNVYQYALNVSGSATYTRDGNAYNAVLKGGLNHGGDEFKEKDWLWFAPILSTSSGDPTIEFKAYGCDNPSVAPELLATVELDDPDLLNGVDLYFRNIYFQDRLSVAINGEGVDLSARQFQMRRVDTDGITRS